MHMGSRSGGLTQGDSSIRAMAKEEYEGSPTLDDVQKIRMNKGQLMKVKVAGKPKNKF